MGFFKDMRNLQKAAKDMPRPSLREGVAQAAQMVGELQEQQAKAQRLMSVGLIGQATIKDLRDTGVTINENPECEIDLEVSLEGQTYDATIKQVVARVAMAGFQPGSTVPVRVDPDDRTSLMIA